MLCTFPALAAASLRGTDTLGESGIRGLEFLAFIAIVALAPVMILFAASAVRMLMGKLGWNSALFLNPYFSLSQPLFSEICLHPGRLGYPMLILGWGR